MDALELAKGIRFHGIFVLRTNTDMAPINTVLRHRDLFRRTKP